MHLIYLVLSHDIELFWSHCDMSHYQAPRLGATPDKGTRRVGAPPTTPTGTVPLPSEQVDESGADSSGLFAIREGRYTRTCGASYPHASWDLQSLRRK